MSKKVCIVANLCLVVWFFFDIIGFQIGNFILVERAWREDGIFFIIYILLFLFFLLKDKYGKYPLIIWLSIWFIVQFMSHWYYTIFGVAEQRLAGYNRFFANTYHIIPSSDKILIPDLYHIVLHIFILFAFISTIAYCMKCRKDKKSIFVSN